MVPVVMDIEELRIQTPWGQIAAKCWNSKDSKPVLIAHGLCDNAGSFDRLIPLLSKEFYYVAVDLPGHGFSSPFPEGFPLDFMNYVHQSQRIIRHFGWEKFSLMGHSFGANVLAVLAASFPKRIEKLILLDLWSPTPIPKEVQFVKYRMQTERLINREEKLKNSKSQYFNTYKEALSNFINIRWSKLSPESAKLILKRCLKKTSEGYILTTDPRAREEVNPIMDEDIYFYQFSKIICPTLIVLGNNSEISFFHHSSYYVDIRKVYERTHVLSKTIKIDGDHCAHINNPEIVAPVINQFLLCQQSKY